MKKFKCIIRVWGYREGEVYEMTPCGDFGYSHEEKTNSWLVPAIIHSVSKEIIEKYFVEVK